MSDTTSNPDDEATEHDQDAEPSLNAPGEAGPTGIEDDDEGAPTGGGTTEGDDADQDSELSWHAPEE